MWGTRGVFPLPKASWQVPMFEPQDSPRVFGLAPGVDFPRGLVRGLCDRLENGPPEAMARVHGTSAAP